MNGAACCYKQGKGFHQVSSTINAGNVDNSCFKMLLKYVDMVSLSSRSSDLSKDLTDHVYCILICEKKWEDCFPFLSYIQFLSGKSLFLSSLFEGIILPQYLI